LPETHAAARLSLAPDVFDPDALSELTGGSAAAIDEILSEFNEANERDAAELAKAFERGEIEETRRLAHRIKGASRMVGLTRYAEACESVESAAKAKDMAALKAAMQKYERELGQIENYLSERITRAAA
jgi:HPt (histidine-containing phosphotransfer) domain-containing protein